MGVQFVVGAPFARLRVAFRGRLVHLLAPGAKRRSCAASHGPAARAVRSTHAPQIRSLLRPAACPRTLMSLTGGLRSSRLGENSPPASARGDRALSLSAASAAAAGGGEEPAAADDGAAPSVTEPLPVFTNEDLQARRAGQMAAGPSLVSTCTPSSDCVQRKALQKPCTGFAAAKPAPARTCPIYHAWPSPHLSGVDLGRGRRGDHPVPGGADRHLRGVRGRLGRVREPDCQVARVRPGGRARGRAGGWGRVRRQQAALAAPRPPAGACGQRDESLRNGLRCALSRRPAPALPACIPAQSNESACEERRHCTAAAGGGRAAAAAGGGDFHTLASDFSCGCHRPAPPAEEGQADEARGRPRPLRVPHREHPPLRAQTQAAHLRRRRHRGAPQDSPPACWLPPLHAPSSAPTGIAAWPCVLAAACRASGLT